MDNKIINTIEDSIISSELGNINKELGEVLIDNILEQGLLKEIPIVSLFTSAINIGTSIQNQFFLKKILKFLLELESIPKNERVDFISKIDQDKKYKTKVGESVLMILDKSDNYSKSQYIGILFKKCIEGKLAYSDFIKMSGIVNRSHLPILLRLTELNKNIEIPKSDYEELFSLGLVTLDLENTETGQSTMKSSLGPSHGGPSKVYNQKLTYVISENGINLTEALFSLQ